MSALATYFALFIAGKKLNILIARFLIHSNYTLEQVPNFDRSIRAEIVVKPVTVFRTWFLISFLNRQEKVNF